LVLLLGLVSPTTESSRTSSSASVNAGDSIDGIT
jgi:hypothetical protein